MCAAMANTSETSVTPAASGVPGLPDDWPEQATTKVVETVDRVRSMSVGPAIRISRGVVYGLLALVLVVIALPIFLIGVTRLLDYAIPGNIYWIYLGIGTAFTAIGLFLWSRRPRDAARP